MLEKVSATDAINFSAKLLFCELLGWLIGVLFRNEITKFTAFFRL
jgi:hypothetical protein